LSNTLIKQLIVLKGNDNLKSKEREVLT